MKLQESFLITQFPSSLRDGSMNYISSLPREKNYKIFHMERRATCAQPKHAEKSCYGDVQQVVVFAIATAYYFPRCCDVCAN